MIRKPIVAGQFYPGNKKDLDSFFDNIIQLNQQKIKAKSIIAPHAGYIYSGKTAAQAYSLAEIPDNIILLGPNHTGRGTPISVYPPGAWETPYGQVPINEQAVNLIVDKTPFAQKDANAHIFEHSLEVHLPFLQYIKRDNSFTIVPICIADENTQHLQDLSQAIYETIKETQNETLIIASTDFSHYEPASIAKEKDSQCIDAIIKLNETRLIQTVYEKNVSMCGYLPVFVAISAAKKLGAKNGKLIKYSTSGDITGDNTEVVGYASIILE